MHQMKGSRMSRFVKTTLVILVLLASLSVAVSACGRLPCCRGFHGPCFELIC
jgi:hypothetical protein